MVGSVPKTLTITILDLRIGRPPYFWQGWGGYLEPTVYTLCSYISVLHSYSTKKADCSRILDSKKKKKITAHFELESADSQFVFIFSVLRYSVNYCHEPGKGQGRRFTVCLCGVQQNVSSEALASPSLGNARSTNSKFSSSLAPVRSLFTRPRIALVK